jgi:glyoxylase-like metal-dependent hydrolase (beta-lactamase superfamily II)/SAM-dependent methyltransferase
MAALGLPVADSWFSVWQVADGITRVAEPHLDSLIRANFYHVRGSEADLIVDTGTGIAPLARVLGGLIDPGKRVIAVATHTHYDHVGGLHEFRERLVHPREQESLAGKGQFVGLLAQDFPVAWRSQVEDGDHQLPEVLIDAIPFEGFDPRCYTLTPAVATRLVDEGDTIALGSRVFEVMHTPGGHSPGGICLLDREAGVLFTGDTVYDSRLFDELPGSDINSYLMTIERLPSLPGIRMVCSGHDDCFDGDRLRELCDAYLSRRGKAARTPTGPGQQEVGDMGSDADGRYSYTDGNAELYGSLGIEGTTYQIGFDAVATLLGDIRGKTFLDFGCGTGRSARFLKQLGAQHVYAVDHDQNMIDQALSQELAGVTVLRIDGPIPLPDASVDGVVCMSVFIEIRTRDAMRGACTEIARTLRPGAPFILESSSPVAFGHAFRSYSYPPAGPLRSGETTPCVVNAPGGQFVIEDTYWTEDDYVDAIEQAGLTVTTIDYPLPRDPAAWFTDEASIPPCIIIEARKPT